MSQFNIRRWSGAFGIAPGVLILILIVLYGAAGTSPRAEDTVGWSNYVTKHNGLILTISLIGALSAACFLVFLAGFRYLIRQTRAYYEWASVLVFSAGLVATTLGLVGYSFLASGALDTVNNKTDPTVVSALGEGSTPALGAIGVIMLTLFLASAGYAIWGTGVLPKWMG